MTNVWTWIGAVSVACFLCCTWPAAAKQHPLAQHHHQKHVHHKEHVSAQAAKKHRGKASVYSRKFAYKRMADGTRLDLESNAAASRQLPLGSRAKVTNLQNGKSAEVRIRDRGPYVKGRIIDLSPRTAKNLNIGFRGVVPVEVTPIKEPGEEQAAAKSHVHKPH